MGRRKAYRKVLMAWHMVRKMRGQGSKEDHLQYAVETDS